MLPIIAAIPAPLDITLGFSLVVPALGALALCCMALVLAVAPRARRSTRLSSAARPSYACSAPR